MECRIPNANRMLVVEDFSFSHREYRTVVRHRPTFIPTPGRAAEESEGTSSLWLQRHIEQIEYLALLLLLMTAGLIGLLYIAAKDLYSCGILHIVSTAEC